MRYWVTLWWETWFGSGESKIWAITSIGYAVWIYLHYSEWDKLQTAAFSYGLGCAITRWAVAK